MTEPKLSVIIPFYNDRDHIAACLDSLARQSLREFEAICVDDGSTDGSLAIVEEFAGRDTRLRLHRMAANGGQAAARNAGTRQATGKYLFHLDADDYLAPDALEHLHAVAEADGADIVYGRAVLFDRATGAQLRYRNDSRYVIVNLRRTTLNNYPSLVYAHNTLNRLYRRQFLLEHDLWFETEPRWAEDVLFSLTTNFRAGAISISMHPTYYYRFGNFLGKATVEKCQNARDNMIRGLRLIEQEGEPPLVREMQRKQAVEASHLLRAAQVFDRQQLLAYLPTLLPMVESTPEEVLATLPSYPKRFAALLREGRFEEALLAWERQSEKPLPRWFEHRLVHRIKPLLPIWMKDSVKRAVWRLKG